MPVHVGNSWSELPSQYSLRQLYNYTTYITFDVICVRYIMQGLIKTWKWTLTAVVVLICLDSEHQRIHHPLGTW